MRVIAKSRLREFWEQYPDAEEVLQVWYREACAANWATPQDVKARYRTASFLADDRVVFNIKGNNYRLVVRVLYQFQMVYIRFVGTHKAYDDIDATTV